MKAAPGAARAARRDKYPSSCLLYPIHVMLLMLKLAASKPKLIIEFCAGRGLLGKTVAAKMGSDCYSCRALWIAWPGQIRDARATVEELRQSHDDASGKNGQDGPPEGNREGKRAHDESPGRL